MQYIVRLLLLGLLLQEVLTLFFHQNIFPDPNRHAYVESISNFVHIGGAVSVPDIEAGCFLGPEGNRVSFEEVSKGGEKIV
jgi:hypothetical protein